MRFLDAYTTVGAAELLYDHLRERSNEPHINVSHQELPDFGMHLKFVRSEPYRIWCVIQDQRGENVGQISVTRLNEVGVGIFKDRRGEGFATEALQKLIAEYKPLPNVPSQRRARFVANINPANNISIKLFEGLGFKHIQNTYELADV